jgi:hypothetical protein
MQLKSTLVAEVNARQHGLGIPVESSSGVPDPGL